MAIMQIDVPERTAQRFWNSKVVSIYEVQEALFEDEESEYTRIVDFWEGGIGKKEFEEYLQEKSNGKIKW